MNVVFSVALFKGTEHYFMTTGPLDEPTLERNLGETKLVYKAEHLCIHLYMKCRPTCTMANAVRVDEAAGSSFKVCNIFVLISFFFPRIIA